MSTIERSVEIDVPVRSAYNQWTQFEQFPQFMEGVKEVHQLDAKRLHWHAEIGGLERQWTSEIVEQIPDKQISWRSVDGPRNNGVVVFDALGPERTRVTLRMDYDPRGFVENAGDFIGVIERRAQGDLERFKQFLEARGGETGQWRGEIHGNQVKGSTRGREQGARSEKGAVRQSGARTERPSGSLSTAQLWSQNPFALLHQLSNDMDRLFDSFLQRDIRPRSLSGGSSGGSWPTAAWSPQIDVRQRDGHLVVFVDLPGLKADDVEVSVSEGMLTIEGERHDDYETGEGAGYRVERTYGSFFRSIPLPEGVNPDVVQARLRNGVLEIDIPIAAAEQNERKKIQIQGEPVREAQPSIGPSS